MGTRDLPFEKVIYIEKDDFMENPPKGYFRLAPNKEVRLRYAYFIKCQEVIKDSNGEIIELRCTYDPESKGGKSPDGRKVQGTIHWVAAQHAIEAEVRLYDRLFSKENPDEVEEGKDYLSNLNPDSLRVITALVEPSLQNAQVLSKYQFERLGYFCVDKDSSAEKLVFNRTVTLKDSWARQNKK
jgi:glutaminyl-tRNA synthetase